MLKAANATLIAICWLAYTGVSATAQVLVQVHVVNSTITFQNPSASFQDTFNLAQNPSPSFGLYFEVRNPPANMTYSMRYVEPDGTVALDIGTIPTGIPGPPSDWFFLNWQTPTLDVPGQWQIALDINGANLANVPFTVTCGNSTLDSLIPDYQVFGAVDVTFSLDNPPKCSSFTQSAHSAYFSFSQLNTNSGSSYALIRYPLTVPAIGGGTFGLDTWVTLLGAPTYQGVINSGYRTPSHNAAVGGVGGSRHLWGDAVDLQNKVHPSGTRTSCNPQYPNPPQTSSPCFAEYKRMVQAAWYSLASYVEPPSLSCAYNCVHADWRNISGAFQQ